MPRPSSYDFLTCASPRKKPACIFYSRGFYRNGPGCGLSHISTSNNGRRQRSGRKRRFDGGSSGDDEKEHVERHDHRNLQRKRSRLSESNSIGENSLEKADGNGETACGVCLEDVVKARKRFALLTYCQHAFCVDCIGEWRKTFGKDGRKMGRTCPLCRKWSDFAVKSFYWVTRDEKNAAVKTYLDQCAKLACKRFGGRNRYQERPGCKFGNDCFYQHITADGKVFIRGTRLFVNCDGAGIERLPR